MLYRLTPLCLLSLVLTASPAYPHVLKVNYQVLPGNKVQIKAYYKPGNDSAVDAIVRVYRPDGQLLREPGVIDEKGFFVFSYQRAENLHVEVAQDGHLGKADISADKLTNAPPVMPEHGSVPESSAPPVWELVAGLSLVLAAAAFFLSVRMAQRLRALEKRAAPPFSLALPPSPPQLSTAITAAPAATGTPRPTTLPTGPAPG
jgi:hypothetical protein